jgi:hypothetical protein
MLLRPHRPLAALCLLLAATGCDGCSDDADGGEGGGGGASASTGAAPTSSSTGAGGDDVSVAVSSTGSSQPGPCAEVSCEPGFACVEDGDGAGDCAPLSCEEAGCSATEECLEVDGGGHVCDDISCDDSLECPEARFCSDEGLCVDDVCTPGAGRCEDQTIVACADDGSGEVSNVVCGSDAYFESVCTEDGDEAFCPCEDDWDCPPNTVCEVGACVGTGLAPTCQVPPSPFDELLPAAEITWGSERGVLPALAEGSPYPASTNVTMTPLVVNLDDDNGDGLINERDFAEVVFVTSLTDSFSNNAVLRAIRGGGPDKGADVFAVYGTTTWHAGDPMPTDCTTGASADCAGAVLRPLAGIAAGDLDGDGTPEIVALTETGTIQIFRNDGTLEHETTPAPVGTTASSVSLHDIDGDGFAEISVGNLVVVLEHDALGTIVERDRFVGALGVGSNASGRTNCVANVIGDTRQEIVAGSTMYALPRPPAGATSIADCAMFPPSTPEETAFCSGQLVTIWDGLTVNGAGSLPNRNGLCAIADVLGADQVAAPGPENPLDGAPEVVLIVAARLVVLDGATGALRRSIPFAGTLGGAPNVDDFDGDGFPEIGTAASVSYKVFDLQEPSAACPAWPDTLSDDESLDGPQSNPPRTPPSGGCTTDADCASAAAGTVCNETIGQCVCLHNGWERGTEDNSSEITGSSVFDFNGDGGAEVVYNDECFFRIYDGLTARVLFREPSESPTQIEYPVIADVDNDGNAEIVFGTNAGSDRCSLDQDEEYRGGLEVWGDPTDQWVSARRIWNQHAYHVTNVTEGGAIPAIEPESWRPYGERLYNTYRSNPRSYGVAPDLAVAAIQVSSPDATCGELGELLDVSVRIENRGDLRVGPGVVVAFSGSWSSPTFDDALRGDDGAPLVVALGQSLEPGESTIVTVSYDAANNDPGTLPDSVRVVVDAEGAETECDESNNEAEEPVEAGDQLPDLRIEVAAELEGTCANARLETTVANEGSAPASDVLVRYYAGDPEQGGLPLHDETIAGPIAPGDEVTIEPAIGAVPSGAIVHAVVDPADAIAECDDGDNEDRVEVGLVCGPN